MKPKIIIPAVILLGAAGGFAFWQQHERESGSDRLTLSGNVDIRQAELAFNASERIAQLTAKEGAMVRAGELLGRLDSTRLEQNLALADARRDGQRQLLKRLESGSRPEEIDKARAEALAATIDAQSAERTRNRLSALAQKNFVSHEQADNAKTAAEAAQAREQAARQSLRLLVLGPRREDIDAARAALAAADAEVALAKKALADAALYSPADGVIQNRILEPGDMASPQRPAYTLAFTDPVWVRAYVRGPDLGKIKPGMAAEVFTDSYPQQRFPGWVGYISPAAEFTPKSVETAEVRTSLVYQVRIFVCNPQNELRLGMPATAVIKLGAATVAGDCKR